MLKLIVVVMTSLSSLYLLANEAPEKWANPTVDSRISESILYLPIADEKVRSVVLNPTNEAIVDLLEVKNPRIIPLSAIDKNYENTYDGYSKVRLGVYQRLLKMLEILPADVGIAYFEGLRPLWKQKEYFDKKFSELLLEIKDKELAYNATAKSVSPFIDNIPTHATGAAIDITLFKIKDTGYEFYDMGMFDTIYGHNPQQETFSENTTDEQRKNRLLLLEVTEKVGLVNYGFEWWHYSYGDKAWGYVKNEEAIYGLVTEKNDPILSMDKETYMKSFDKLLESKDFVSTINKTYTEEYCTQLEMAYGDSMMSEGGYQAIDNMFKDVNLKNKTALDFGSGLGGVAFYLASKYKTQVTGVEINPEMIQLAFKKRPTELEGLVDFKLIGEDQKLPFPDNSFDIVYSKGVIVHLPSKERELAFRELYRVLKKGGRLVIHDWLSPEDGKWSNEIQKLIETESLPLYAHSVKSYATDLTEYGFIDVEHTDFSFEYIQYNQDVINRLSSNDVKNAFISQYGQELYEEHLDGYKDIRDAHAKGTGINVHFMAKKE